MHQSFPFIQSTAWTQNPPPQRSLPWMEIWTCNLLILYSLPQLLSPNTHNINTWGNNMGFPGTNNKCPSITGAWMVCAWRVGETTGWKGETKPWCNIPATWRRGWAWLSGSSNAWCACRPTAVQRNDRTAPPADKNITNDTVLGKNRSKVNTLKTESCTLTHTCQKSQLDSQLLFRGVLNN